MSRALLLAMSLSLLACGAPSHDALQRCNTDYRDLAATMARELPNAQNAGVVSCRTTSNVRDAPGVIVEISDAELATLLQQLEIPFERQKPHVFVVQLNGIKAVLFNHEQNLQIVAGFKDSGANFKDLNDWNRARRFSRTYLDAEGDPVIESDLDLERGATRPAVAEFIRVFKMSVTLYARTLANKQKLSL